MHVSLNCHNVFAIQVTSITAADYDERVLTIDIENIYVTVETLRLYEVEMCTPPISDGDGCEEIYSDNQLRYIRKLTALEVGEYDTTGDVTSLTVEYTISSNTDGDKFFYLEASWTIDDVETPNSSYSCLFEYKLTTLNQRIVINPDAKGEPLHRYDNVQYSPSRVLAIKVNLLEDELENIYSGEVYVFEENVSRYSYWLIEDGIFDFGLQSYGDGLKTINIFLVKKGVLINENGNVYQQLTAANDANAKKVTKTIHLDTIGPEITLEGGDWIVIHQNEKYEPQVATCKDAVFSNDSCIVTNDANIVKINYKSDKYQVVTYEATDKLGNTNTLSVRIKVLQEEDNSKLILYLVISGVALLITGAILAYILIKNNEKKKKISYI